MTIGRKPVGCVATEAAKTLRVWQLATANVHRYTLQADHQPVAFSQHPSKSDAGSYPPERRWLRPGGVLKRRNLSVGLSRECKWDAFTVACPIRKGFGGCGEFCNLACNLILGLP